MTNEELNIEFQKIAGQLKSFVIRITANAADAEDITQDTYIRASTKLESFKGASSIKTWIFSIAANLAKDHLRARKRWPENALDITKSAALSNRQFFAEAMDIRMNSPQGKYEVKEHIVFCFACI